MSVRSNPESSYSTANEQTKGDNVFESLSFKGNIIDNLRSSVRAEAAQQNLFHGKNSSDISSGISSSSSSSSADSQIDDDVDADDLDCEQSMSHGNTVNWKNGTVVTQEGTERRMTIEEMETMRCEQKQKIFHGLIPTPFCDTGKKGIECMQS